MADLNAIVNFILNGFTQIIGIYTGSLLMATVLGTWFVGEIIKIFRRILP